MKIETHNLRFTFRGGPLDGQSKIKTAVGRWPMYLDEDGETRIKASVGDARRRSTRKNARGVYIRTDIADISIIPTVWTHVYVHSSIDPRRDHS